MPPKKKSSAKAPATAQANSSTRSAGRAAPESFTTARGKEYTSTAAATRPTRKTQQAQPIVPSTDPVRTANPKIAPSTVIYTGRAAAAIANDAPKTRGTGRPMKNATTTTTTAAASKKRGRPAQETTANEPPKKRGRPAKAAATTAAPKKRGRPAKFDAVPPVGEQATPKKRGRPPKGGETTKIDEDDEDAAEQLEEELLDAVEDEDAPDAEPEEATISRKRKVPASRQGKGKKNDAADVEQETAVASGKQYWLMKAEQDGHDETLNNGEVFNTKFTIDDLRSKGGPEPWDGVRNAGAAKNMRAMKQGDLAFFYASGGKSPGIVGIMEIVKEHEPDQTAWQENSYGYLENEKDRKKWCVVHVEFRKKLRKPVSRAELKTHVDNGGALSGMQEFNAARLSVSRVSEEEWDFIHSLIEGGYEEDEEADDVLPGAEQANAIDESNLEKANVETIISEQRNGGIVLEQTQDMEIGLSATPDGFAPAAVMTTTEPETHTTGTLFPVESSILGPPSSRPTSRGTGVKGLTSSRPGSAGSLAPPGKIGRARSRSKTPLARGPSREPETTPVAEGAAMPAIQE